MNFQNVKTGYEIKQEIVNIYEKVKLRLNGNIQTAGVVELLDQFKASFRPSVNDYIELMNSLHTYRNSLNPSNNIDLYTAIDEVIQTIKNSLLDMKVGIGNLDGTQGSKEHVFKSDYVFTDTLIMSKLLELSNPTILETVQTTFDAIDSSNDYEAASNILLDLYTIQQTPSIIAQNIENILFNKNLNNYLVPSSFFNPTNIFAPLSDTRGAITLIQLVKSTLGTPHLTSQSYWNNTPWTSDVWTLTDIINQLKNSVATISETPVNQTFLAILILSAFYEDQAFVLNGLEPHTLISDLALDLTTSGMSLEKIVANILNIDSESITDAESLVTSLYGCFKFGAGSSIKGQADYLYSYLPSDLYAINSNVEAIYEEFEQKWITYFEHFQYVSQVNPYKQFAYYVGQISSDVTPDPDLIRAIEMDIIASGNDLNTIGYNLMMSILTSFFEVFQPSQEFLNRLEYFFSLNPNFASPLFFQLYVNFVNNFYRSINFGPYSSFLANELDSYLSASAVSASDFVISLNNAAINSEINNYQSLASQIYELIHSSEVGFVSNLEQDIAMGNQNIDNIKYLLSHLDGQTSSEIVANMYSAWGGGYISANPGARSLAASIDNSLVQASEISQYFVENPNLNFNYDINYARAIACTIDRLINPYSSNADLIAKLEADILCANKSPQEVITTITNINAFDGPSFAAILYRQLGFPYCSPYAGYMDLANKIEEFVKSDYSTTINSVYGEIDIIPKAKYLNHCTIEDGQYTVRHSVFYLFDNLGAGIPLQEMQDLATLTGRHSARAQCARFLALNHAEDLYITTTKPGGTQGTAEITGCSPALDPGVFTAHCEAAFSDPLYP